LVEHELAVFVRRAERRLRERGTILRLRGELGACLAHLTVDHLRHVGVGDFDLEVGRLLDQQLLLDHVVERLDLERPLRRVTRRLRHFAALDSTQRALPEIDHRDRLIANHGDHAVEQHRLLLRLRGRHRLLSSNRSGGEQCE
jgi:hypothetical protein